MKQINLNRYKSADAGMNFLTNTSDFVAIGTPAALLAVGFIQDDASLKKEGLNAAVAVVGAYGVGYVLKKTIDRNRPYVKYPLLQNYKIENDSSFPSGSTSVAFSAATSLSLSYPKWYVIAPAALYATGVGYSRLHLGVHYPSDVLAGAILGAGSAIVSRQLNKMLVNEFRKRKVKKSTF
ncbi:phosphatase PAP2 family protein [Lacihabitans soyangensis]|uniref:phosphatase PAP2 family protein n=1 Tax=Lacihabitans soyangensis TaxID=869394 RepID=UPI0020CE3E07|nr:phosphatase PAP2 family protein [Lacihabitans soyangensis]